MLHQLLINAVGGVRFAQGNGATLRDRLARACGFSGGRFMNNHHPWPKQRRGNGSTVIAILLIALGFALAISMLIGSTGERQAKIDETFFTEVR
jgi:hypothetical protein